MNNINIYVSFCDKRYCVHMHGQNVSLYIAWSVVIVLEERVAILFPNGVRVDRFVIEGLLIDT